MTEQELKKELIDALVMTRLSDFAGPDMRVIEDAIAKLMPIVLRARIEQTEAQDD